MYCSKCGEEVIMVPDYEVELDAGIEQTISEVAEMMADSVEAASRSLPDYTEKSIRELVNRLIDTQVEEGYFKECPITFRDIAYAKTVLIEKLKTIYHTRISYPELKK